MHTWITRGLLAAGVAGCFGEAPNVEMTGPPDEGGSTTSPDGPTAATASTGSVTGDESSDGGEASASGGDATFPTIEAIQPPPGAVGVRFDAPIVIVFSEPMDQASVEAAYASDSLPASAVAMTWDTTGSELTIVADDPLPHATGSSPSRVSAAAITYTIGATAADLSGNAVGEETEVSFFTLREIEQVLPPNAARTGNVREDGAVNVCFALPRPCAGDSGQLADAQYRGFLAIDLGDLPQGITEMEHASLEVEQIELQGTPYISLGSISLHHVQFDVLADAFDTESLVDMGVFSDDSSLGRREADITDSLLADYEAGRGVTQLMIEFESPTDGNGGSDVASFAEEFVATVVYRVP